MSILSIFGRRSAGARPPSTPQRKALARFEEGTGYRDFKLFRRQQAVAFKHRLEEAHGANSGECLSRATVHSTLRALRAFVIWLAGRPGFKSRISYSDADYFNLSEKDVRIARATREQPVPTLAQMHRALVAFAVLTGARDGALASFKMKHVDLPGQRIFQDAREVKTKFSKTFNSTFFPVGGEAQAIVIEWVAHLRDTLLWGNDDPLFPSTRMGLKPAGGFVAVGLDRKHWSSAEPIRRVFRAGFMSADLPYFRPHSLRNMLAQLGERVCRTPEELKAWSQNLGNEDVLTTLRSYGAVAAPRQAEIMLAFASLEEKSDPDDTLLDQLAAMLAKRRRPGLAATAASDGNAAISAPAAVSEDEATV